METGTWKTWMKLFLPACLSSLKLEHYSTVTQQSQAVAAAASGQLSVSLSPCLLHVYVISMQSK